MILPGMKNSFKVEVQLFFAKTFGVIAVVSLRGGDHCSDHVGGFVTQWLWKLMWPLCVNLV